MDEGHDGPPCAGEQPALVKLPVRDGEEDEPEEGIEGRAEKGQEISHARHDFGEDERDGPDARHDQRPDAPSDDGVAVRVVRLAHDAEVEEFRADVGVDDADDNGGYDDEREAALLVGRDAQAAKGRRRGVLAEVPEPDGRGHDEQKGGDGGQHGERLGEVLRLLHLGDEGGEEDLGHPEEGDVQNRVHARHPGGAGEGEGVGPDGAVGRVVAAVSVQRSVLDSGEDEEEEDRNCHAGSCGEKAMVSKKVKKGC